MTTKMSTDLGVLWTAIEDDVARGLSFTHEFPLTAMTRAVAEAIWRLPSSQEGAPRRALDVGTGTGVHALIMSARGYDVDAIDVNADAIRYAEDRAGRLKCAVRGVRTTDTPAIRFHVAGLDDWKQRHGYDLITFNPPAYYHPLGSVANTPVAQGVFVDDDNDREPSGAFLYRLFEKVVSPLLARNGHLICSWPGLERRVIESVHGETRGRIMSPVEKLETWFHITVVGDRNPTAFFDRVARVDSDDYGLHDTFWKNLIAARDKYMYSGLANARDAERQSLEFKFGVLHLVRDSDDPTLFRHHPEPESENKPDGRRPR